MSNHLALNFTLYVKGDGISDTLTINLGTDPIGYSAPGGGFVSEALALGHAIDAVNISGTWSGAAVTKSALVSKVLTLSLAGGTPIPDGSFNLINGTLLF